jgi:uroporphyrinogen-III synthase
MMSAVTVDTLRDIPSANTATFHCSQTARNVTETSARHDGDVVGLLPLEGRVVGVTADRRAEEQTELLQRKGAAVVHGPTMRTLPLAGTDELLAATRRLIADPPDILLATTGIGMRAWLAAAETWDLDRELLAALGRARILARGPKVAGAIQQLGLPMDRQEPSERLRGLVELLIGGGRQLAGAKVALQESGGREPWAVDALAAAGAETTLVPVYRWTLPTDPRPARQLVDAIVGGRVDAVTFTSPPAVGNLFALAAENGAGPAVLRHGLNRAVVAAVGPATAEALSQAGVTSGVAPERGRLGLMVRALAERLGAGDQPASSAVAATELVIQGFVVRRGPVRVELSPRERAVLEALITRRGAVVSRAALLREVWGSEADPKLVDSAISRLRRRLAPADLRIQTVARRGYRIDGEFAPTRSTVGTAVTTLSVARTSAANPGVPASRPAHE